MHAGFGHNQTHARRAFTLVEAIVTVSIILALSAIVVVAVGSALRSARASAERQLAVTLKFGAETFKNDLDYLPPLVNDRDPVIQDPQAGTQPNTRDRAYLQTDTTNGNIEHFSVTTIPFYLMGLLDDDANSGGPIDGAVGPSISPIRADGTFTRRGKPYPASYETTDARRIARGSNTGQIALLDRWGVKTYEQGTWPVAPAGSVTNPQPRLRPQPDADGNTHLTASNPRPFPAAVHYYRWEPRSGPSFNVPVDVAQTFTHRTSGEEYVAPELRNARFAIVIVGPDGQIGTKDDIVEIGG